MAAFWAGSDNDFLHTSRISIVAQLAEMQMRHFRTSERAQVRAWEDSIDVLRTALARFAVPAWILLEYPMLRLGRRADAIVLTDRAVLVLEFKIGTDRFEPAALEQVEDFALDLQDFHSASRAYPIVPILVATGATAPATHDYSLPFPGVVTTVQRASAASLATLLSNLHQRMPDPDSPLDMAGWGAAPYCPVPTIVEAACMLYAHHGVADIAAARADTHNLTSTTWEIQDAIATARAVGDKLALFVTGIPGAGKTLCGLNAAFGVAERARATFLTGNPTLVHVLREALTQDAIGRGADRRATRQKIKSVIQALPNFRDLYVASRDVPAETVVVVDEAQRCWSRDHAMRKTRDRPVRLSASEPAHLLDVMGRHAGFAAMICLIGGGQEIHDGEGGLAAWGEALRDRPAWRVLAAPDAVAAADPRQRLGGVPGLAVSAALHLDVGVRQIRGAAAAGWVDRVLVGDVSGAAAVAAAAGGVPFLLTRSLAAMRGWLPAAARGSRRAGLLASAGGKRLRAEGLGVELPHMDAALVARWFLGRWPDVRASDALEVVATEFSCQGLELDFAGVCWDGDLVRVPGRADWQVRSFRGTKWTLPAGAEAIANQINTYRVLLTRARYETILFVPRGDAADRTRSPETFDAVADFLQACGAASLPTPVSPPIQQREALLL